MFASVQIPSFNAQLMHVSISRFNIRILHEHTHLKFGVQVSSKCVPSVFVAFVVYLFVLSG